MLIDLHTHTDPLSHDSLLSHLDLIIDPAKTASATHWPGGALSSTGTFILGVDQG